ncbi:YHS domain-containing protein, partial [Acinetobacter baumannii]
MDHHHEDKNTSNRLIDPVCGMAVTQASKFYEKIDNKTFYFCSEKCKLKFENDPLFYINEEGK